ncbi:MAG TPA: serine hydrolase domain-containing protein [Gaiellales bacterium]|jgi:CubicO group peptidase (beta-lactamase class C family)
MSRAVGAVAGSVSPGYEIVRATFAEVVESQQPGTGAAFAAVVDGHLVVDLWGGETNAAGRPWQEDTLAVLFSGTKGIVATALLTLVEQRRLLLTDRVADHWPAFAAAGKTDITVAQLGAHAAGLPYVSEALGAADLADLDVVAELLALQAPVTPVGRPCYHAITWGWLMDGLIRHACHTGATDLVREALAEPHDLDLRIGLAGDRDAEGRLAMVSRSPDYQLSAMAVKDPDPRLEQVYARPHLREDDAAWLQHPMPAANGIATARAVATLYGAVLTGRVIGMQTLGAAVAPAAEGPDPLSGRPLRFGPSGYELAGTPSELGPADDAFGHTGAGGSSHGAWPSLRTAFSFVTSELRREGRDDRARRLLDGLYTALRRA